MYVAMHVCIYKLHCYAHLCKEFHLTNFPVCFQEMLSIKDLEDMRGTRERIPKLLKVKVVAVDGPKCALADASGVIKASIGDTDLIPKMQRSVALRNFKLGRNIIFLDKNVGISRCANVNIPTSVEQMALELLNPPEPPTKDIKEVQKSPVKSLTSLIAVVKQVGVFNCVSLYISIYSMQYSFIIQPIIQSCT